jgi:hypothetical protein
LCVFLDAYDEFNIIFNKISKPFDPNKLTIRQQAGDPLRAKDREKSIDYFDSFLGI